jgi:alpha-galactosidase
VNRLSALRSGSQGSEHGGGHQIVFLGGSSASFGIGMFRDVFSSHDLTGSTLVLVGRNAGRLARAGRVATLLNEKSGAGLGTECTTDWWAAVKCV